MALLCCACPARLPAYGQGACIDHTLGFAGMVLPVTEFILDVLSHNETKSQQQQQQW